jgi:hypothetical protein
MSFNEATVNWYRDRQMRAELIAFRDLNGWTQEKAASWYGCAARTWRRYELGERPIPKPLLLRIRDYRIRYPLGAKGRQRRLAAI